MKENKQDKQYLKDEPAETDSGMYLSLLADKPGEPEAAMNLNAIIDDPEELQQSAAELIREADKPRKHRL